MPNRKSGLDGSYEKAAFLQSGLPMGSVLGIRIYADWSWFFIFFLVTWSLAAGLFPQVHPDWGLGFRWLWALLASSLFFASVLAHELAHSVVARSRGLAVSRIKLFLFGGVSNLEREPPSPGTEFWMTIVGPLTSIAIGFVFLWLTGLIAPNVFETVSEPLKVFSGLDAVATLFFWLGPVNILVGLFNLIPAFPLDGGRVLRALLWLATGNLRKATRWAARTGQVISWLMIVAGVSMAFGARLPIFGTGLFSGLWLVLLAWFLSNMAVQSYQQVMVEDLLEGIPVSRLMRAGVSTVSPDLSVSVLVYDYLLGTEDRAFPVEENGRLVGLVSLEDVRKVPRHDWGAASVAQIMTPKERLALASPEEEATQALTDIVQRDVNQVPVVSDGHLVGMLRRTDIVRWLQLQSEYVV